MSSLLATSAAAAAASKQSQHPWTDTLKRLRTDLVVRSDVVRNKAAKDLAKFVATQAREMKPETFFTFMADLAKEYIYPLCYSSQPSENLGGVLAIDELADVDFRSYTQSVARLADNLKMVLNQSSDANVLTAAAKALGRLARLPITMISETCQSEMKRALETLAATAKERHEIKRLGALLVLRALAGDAPTLFYGQMPSFVELVWVGLRDVKLQLREIAAEALGLALRIISERDNALQWNRMFYAEANLGFKVNTVEASVNSIHGSLLCIGQLLAHSHEFMTSHTEEVCQTLNKYRDGKDKLVKQTVIQLLPKVAASNPEVFVKMNFLQSAMEEYLLPLLSHAQDADRSCALLAVGEMAVAVKSEIKRFLDSIIKEIQRTLAQKDTKPEGVNEALSAIALLVEGVGTAMHRGVGMRDFLDQIFSVELSPTLIKCLAALVTHIPSLLKEIQIRLMNVLSTILAQQPFSSDASKAHKESKDKRKRMEKRLSLANVKKAVIGAADKLTPGADKASKASKDGAAKEQAPAAAEEEKAPEQIALALKTLGSFNLTGYINNIDEFLRDIAHYYLEEENAAVRSEAAVAVSQLLVRICVNPTRQTSPILLAEVLERLLILGTSDPDPLIRRTVLENLDPRLDNYLADADNLRSMFIALNDEEFAIREMAITILGRLALRNPAYVMPSLRRTLIQQLTELEFSGDSRIKEESARLLAAFIRSSRHLIEPYVKPILKALLPKMDASQDPRVRQEVLGALGELSAAAPEEMAEHIDFLLTILVQFLDDHASTSRRETGLTVLGQLAQSTSHLVNPLERDPRIIDILLDIIKVEKSRKVRQLVLKVMGQLGAIDTYTYKQLQLQSAEKFKPKAEERDSTTFAGENAFAQGEVTEADNFYSTAAVEALTTILNDVSMSAYHPKVINALIHIVKDTLAANDQRIESQLRTIMPPFLEATRTADQSVAVVLFDKLAVLISIVKSKAGLRTYLDDLFNIIQDAWQSNLLPHILGLIEEISLALGEEFKVYLPVIIPKLLQVLQPDNHELCPRILRTIEVIGPHLDDYLHLITPAVMNLVGQVEKDDVRIFAIQTTGRLCRILNVSEFASRIIHPMARLLQQTQPTEISPSLQQAIMATLCHLLYQLGPDYAMFIPMMNRIISRQHITYSSYDMLVSKLLKSQPLLESELPNLGDITSTRKSLSSIEDAAMPYKASVEQNLKKTWGVSQQSTKEDWAEWMRRFSIELIRESPEASIRQCFELAQEYYPLVRSLFNVAFVSCWNALGKQARAEFIDNLRVALKSPHMPPEILQMWLNVAEFMEHVKLSLPIEIKELARLASKCRAYAKALHYKELEFQTQRNSDAIESLISLNNQLQQPEAAEGILRYAQEGLAVELKESWYEKLHRWEDALKVYKSKKDEFTSIVGQMRCLNALGEWEKLLELSESMYGAAPEGDRQQIALFAAAAACNLNKWDSISAYVPLLQDDVDGAIIKTLLALQRAETADQYAEVRALIAKTRELVDTELTALVAESYSRAYDALVSVQILSEMEETMDFKQYPDRRDVIKKSWRARLSRCQPDIKTWQRILSFRSVAETDVESWLKFASLCRKNGALRQSHKVLVKLFGLDPSRQPMAPLPAQKPAVTFQYILQLWTAGAREVAHQQLVKFQRCVVDDPRMLARVSLKLGTWEHSMHESQLTASTSNAILANLYRAVESAPNWYKAWHVWAAVNFDFTSEYEKRLGRSSAHKDSSALAAYSTANLGAGVSSEKLGGLPTVDAGDAEVSRGQVLLHAENAVRGFFKSLSLAPKHVGLQDTLRLLTLWFKYGGEKAIEAALLEGFNAVSIDAWLQVIPQLIARMDSPIGAVRRLITELLTRVGKAHPQALVYPLTLAAKSQVQSRKTMALSMMDQMRSSLLPAHPSVAPLGSSLSRLSLPEAEIATPRGSAFDEHNLGTAATVAMHARPSSLLDQALLVSEELIRVAITEFEAWHEALEDSSRLYFTENNPDGMLRTLLPLHGLLRKAPETTLQSTFQQTYGGMLNDAWVWCEKYIESGSRMWLNQAWDIYYHTFKSITKQLEKMTTLELRAASPRLLYAKNLDLAVPGTYESGKPVVKIGHFHSTLQIINSKQRPRKLKARGSDGNDYAFLLKGHEDLRQDERVMQLFGLINNLLVNSPRTANRHLRIKRYSVIPLAPNSGLLGWVPHCDTLHQLIKEYRASSDQKLAFNLEFKLLNQISGDYNSLMAIQKIEVFKFTLSKTDGKDLARIMWMKSPSSEVWLDRRNNYTRSLAVMSMAGYILGLGDRHPSNIMIDRATGHVVHIDFGDCFEVASLRDKFPEKVPFRLTRMLVNAMEASGIEGNFRTTCEQVMSVLRENRDSVMAVLEAFVYDPLINWRLLQTGGAGSGTTDAAKREDGPPTVSFSSFGTSYITASFIESEGSDQAINERALTVIARVNKKLTGRDFEIAEEDGLPNRRPPLNTQEQVNKLIQQATSLDNLAVLYPGWCSFF